MAASKSQFCIRSVLLYVLLTGCQRTAQPYVQTPENFTKGMVKVGELVSRYGELRAPQCHEQFKQVLERLGYSDTSGYTIRILSTTQPAAFSPGAKVILLSRGLIRLLHSESQIAFVIAHELSHYNLGHVEDVSHLGSEQSSTWRKELEISADQKALTLLVQGGYEPTEAVTALQAVYKNIQESNERALYPSLVERITAISQQIASARIALGPGTINRRDFTRCRQSL